MSKKTEDVAVLNYPNDQLPAETAEKYEIIDWVGGNRQYFGKFGIIDIKQLTPRRAGQLVRMKFKKIKEKK